MFVSKCPGQDMRYWTAEDIHEQPCPYCGEPIEFFKTDIRLRCPRCKQKVPNPRFNLGCAAWCAYAEQCLGAAATGKAPQSLKQVLDNELARLVHGLPLQLKEIKEKLGRVEAACREKQMDPLPLLAAAVILGARELDRLPDPEKFVRSLIEEHHFPVDAAEETMTIIRNIESGKQGGEKEELVAGLFA